MGGVRPSVGHGERKGVGAALVRVGRPVLSIDKSAVPNTVTLAESLLFDGFGSGVELDTLAPFDSVVSRATTVAVIVTVAVLSLASVPSEHDTVRSHLPCVDCASTTVKPGSIGSLTVTF